MPPRQCTKTKHEIANQSRRICLPIDRETYTEVLNDKQDFRVMLDDLIAKYPELFPSDIAKGYQLYGFRRQSKKMPDVQLRRICLKQQNEDGRLQVYTVTPSFILPYMMGDANDVEKALFLRRFAVPFWALTYVFGQNDMYWYRLTTRFGRNNIVGTTIKDPSHLPQDLLADEKHTHFNGHKAYVATTVGANCILGTSIELSADEDHLTQAYRQFKDEVEQLKPNYQPKTVNTDGWAATQLAWKTLFPTIVIIQCFLHAYITIRSRCKGLKALFPLICQQVWDIYHAEDLADFEQRIEQLQAWAQSHLTGSSLESVLKLCHKSPLFAVAFDYPTAYRTSNMLDRHMNPMDRCLHSSRYFHGHLMSAEFQIRAWALFHNFQPYCPRAKIRQSYSSPFQQVNGFVYHDNWLQNLLVASSLGGQYATNTKR